MAESKFDARQGRLQQQQQQQQHQHPQHPQQQPILTPRGGGGDRSLRYSPQRAPQSLHNPGQTNYTRFDSPRTQTINGPQQMSHQPIATPRFQVAPTQQQQQQQQQDIRGASDGHGLGASSYYLPQNEVKLRRHFPLPNNCFLPLPGTFLGSASFPSIAIIFIVFLDARHSKPHFIASAGVAPRFAALPRLSRDLRTAIVRVPLAPD